MTSNKKWWQPKNPKKGFLGMLHAVKNILTEGLRLLLNKLGINVRFNIRGRDVDLARILSDVISLAAIVVLAVFVYKNFSNVQ